MQSKEDILASYSHEKELERAKWYKEDLDKGGWREASRGPGYVYWIKTFPDEEVPIKVLGSYDMPLSAETYLEVMNARNQEKRDKWDTVFVDHEILETYPDGGRMQFMRYPLSFPLWDRSFLLYFPPVKEIDWYGKRAFLQVQKNACHPTKPEGADGLVRTTNGGNFTVVIPDESKPEEACKFFLLSNNNLNGWLPRKHIEWVVEKKACPSFNNFFASIIKGYNEFFKHD